MNSQMKAMTVGLIASIAVAVSVYGQEIKIPLNGSLETSTGDKPFFVKGIDFADGHSGKAAVIDDKAALGYNIPSQINPSKEGTISLWLKTNWSSRILSEKETNKMFYYIFDMTDAKGQAGLKAYIFYYKPNHSITAYFTARDKYGILHSVSAPLGRWEENHWYRLVFSWKDGEKLAIYLDDGVDEATLISGSKIEIGVDGEWTDPDKKGRTWKQIVSENQVVPETWTLDEGFTGKLALGIWMRRISWGQVNPNYTEGNHLDGAIQEVVLKPTAQ
jgi:hypothetical protein